MELPVRLRSAKELYQYSCDNGFGKGFGKNWGLRNFALVEKRLEPDEAAFLTFVGLHRFHSMSAHQRNFAYAITNRRIMLEKDNITIGMSCDCAGALSARLTELLPLIQELAQGLCGGEEQEQ